MTLEEAIKELKCDNEHCFNQCEGVCASIKNYKCNCKDAIIERMLDELLQYRKIGTVEECREAMEKQKPKKPRKRIDKFSNTYKCPYCDYEFIHKDETGWFCGRHYKFCPNCQQAIQWNESLEGME